MQSYIDSNINDIISMELDVYKAKLLAYIKRYEEKNREVFKKAIKISVLGVHYTVKFFKPYIEELKKEKAIIEEDKKIYLTEKGSKLLATNKHLLRKFQPNIKKTRCDKAIPSNEDIQILNNLREKVKNNYDFSNFKIKELALEINMTHQLVSYRMNRLKKAGAINFTPRKYNTLTVTEKGNRLIN